MRSDCKGCRGRRLNGQLIRPLQSPVSRALEVGYAFAGSGVSCFAKCSRAASAASGVMIHEVFFASAVRVKFLRRYPRRLFGSMPISSARALGVSGAVDMVPLSDDASDAGLRSINMPTSYASAVMKMYGVCMHFVNIIHVIPSIDVLKHPPPYRPPEGPIDFRQPQARAKRAHRRIFGNLRATCVALNADAC